MKIQYCCGNAKSTAYARYGRVVTRVKHETILGESGEVYTATGTITEPDIRVVPAKTSRRFFVLSYHHVVIKMYICPDCILLHPNGAWFKTKSEALAALVTETLTHA